MLRSLVEYMTKVPHVQRAGLDVRAERIVSTNGLTLDVSVKAGSTR